MSGAAQRPWSVLLVAIALIGVAIGAVSAPPTSSATALTFSRLDPRFDALVPKTARLELVADGFQWLEGPLWRRHENDLLFSDIPQNAVMRWRPQRGTDVFLKPSGYSGRAPFNGREPGSNGLTLDASGRLVLCEHGDRRVTRLEVDGRRTVLAERYQGKRLNSPNDLVYRRNGDLYFTDPPFGLPQAFDDPRKELPFSGVYRLRADGSLQLLSRDLRAPNGIAFAPDERTLYVTDVDPERPAWWAYAVRADGTLGAPRLFHDARPWTRTRPGGPDGLKVDHAGNVFAAGPGGVYVFTPRGELLGIVETGVATANVAFGDDGSSLYIAASTRIYRLSLSTHGAGFAP